VNFELRRSALRLETWELRQIDYDYEDDDEDEGG
jgi:hypothetical protein